MNRTSSLPILISEDTRIASMQSIKEIRDALSFLFENLQSGKCETSTKANTLSVAKSEMKRLNKMLDGDSDDEEYKNITLDMLQKSYKEIAELRVAMNEKADLVPFVGKLHEMKDSIYHWWQNQGFSYAKMSVEPWRDKTYFKVDFTARIASHIDLHSDTPVTDQEKIAVKLAIMKKELDILLVDEEVFVLDNEKNRDWIRNKIQDKFKGSYVTNWESYSIRRNDNLFQIMSIHAMIDMFSIGEKIELNKGIYE